MTTDALAYAVTGNDLFGVLDLNTGVFTELGDMGQRLVGLGAGSGGVLYGAAYSSGGSGAYNSPNLYTVNPTNGALTLVSNTFSAGFYDFGSTTTGLYADGSDGKLYSINPNTGAATLVGPTLLENFMSTGSSTLYVTGLNDLHSINTTTGAATLVGSPNVGYIDVLTENGTTYAVSEDFKIYTLDGSNGAATFVANVTGTSSFFWGLAPDQPPPTVEPDRAHVQEGHSVTADAAHGVLANDTDPITNDALTVSEFNGQVSNVGIAVAGAYGTLTLNANGSYTYVANAHEKALPSDGVGLDTFTYTAEDGGGTADTTLTVVVTAPGITYSGGTANTTIQGANKRQTGTRWWGR
jgi:VCBS repeat-containing protein